MINVHALKVCFDDGEFVIIPIMYIQVCYLNDITMQNYLTLKSNNVHENICYYVNDLKLVFNRNFMNDNTHQPGICNKTAYERITQYTDIISIIYLYNDYTYKEFYVAYKRDKYDDNEYQNNSISFDNLFTIRIQKND